MAANRAARPEAKVLISILICPTALRFVLSRSEIEAKRCIQEAKTFGWKCDAVQIQDSVVQVVPS